MSPTLSALVELLSVERIEEDIFRGASHDLGTRRVYGGQVLGQAIKAAQATVEGRDLHSAHAYFLRPGDPDVPIVYEVDRARDGRSFSARRVVAIQHRRQIFNLSASFQVPEDGLEHQAPMPEVPPPESLHEILDYNAEALARLPEKVQRFMRITAPFEVRPVEPIDFLHPRPSPPRRHLWLRTTGPVGDDLALHRALLAYVSDYALLTTALLPHGVHVLDGRLQIASLDHAMWFHRALRVDDWLLYAIESPNASHARGLAVGRFYAADGTLVASTAQEGLIRIPLQR